METIWYLCLALSVLCLAILVTTAAIHRRRKTKLFGVLPPLWIGSIGVALAAFFALYPICAGALRAECGVWESILGAVRGTIGLFVADGDFDALLSQVGAPDTLALRVYLAYLSALIVAAPVLTFGFVLSFFENLRAMVRLGWQILTRKNIYVFSELNDEALALAESLHAQASKSVILFTDVHEQEGEVAHERAERAAKLDAILLRHDVSTVSVRRRRGTEGLYFFIIGADQSENLIQALSLIKTHRQSERTHLYVFTSQPEAELLLSNAYREEEGKAPALQIRRVNEVRSLINRTLYERGYENIFASARPTEDGEKQICALVIGMGEHGMEMTKALAWLCQMDGYRVQIHAVDRDPMAESRLRAACPELMMMNGCFGQPEETGYRITVHGGVDVGTAELDRLVAHLPPVTYTFVSLGRDELNVAVATRLRAIFARRKYDTRIQAVVYNSEKKEALAGVTNFKGQPYDVDFIGDRRSSYSASVILSSDIEAEALARHTVWGDVASFWQYDYNYRSSVAAAIHHKLRIQCGIPGADKPKEQRTEEELWAIRRLEHRRWNAYMRAEGYVYGGTTERSGRNDLAKTHNCLVPFSRLPEKEQQKDDD